MWNKKELVALMDRAHAAGLDLEAIILHETLEEIDRLQRELAKTRMELNCLTEQNS